MTLAYISLSLLEELVEIRIQSFSDVLKYLECINLTKTVMVNEHLLDI